MKKLNSEFMKKLNCFFILGLFIVIGCNNYDHEKADFIITDIPNEIKLNSEILTITSVLLNPSRIAIVDSFLVVFQNRKDTLVSIVNLHNLKHQFSFGKKGNGPDEFNLTFPTSFNACYVKGNSCFTVGNKMNNFQYYRMNDIINKNISPFRTEKLSPKLNGFRATAIIGDSLIIGAPYGNENIDLFKYNSNSKQLDVLLEYPKRYPLMSGEIKRSVYGCYLTTKPEDTKFARTFSDMGKVEIFDVEGSKVSLYTILYKNFPTLEENLNLDKTSTGPNATDPKIFSFGISSSEKYIFVQVLNDDYSKIADASGYKESFIPEIHVFNWNGQAVAKLILDSHFISFTVDKAGNNLYTYSHFEPDNIRRYDLSKVNL